MSDDTEGVMFTMNDARRIDRAVSDFEHKIIGRPTPRRQPLSAGGDEPIISHGIIIAQCNLTCSSYRVQRIHRYLSAECDGSGSGSGSGS